MIMTGRTYPRISVITPSLNQGAFIEETIRSVIDQRYPGLEYLVVDGGSKDGSIEIIENYASHLAWWISETDRGQSNAINKALARATGDVVCWLNADDMFTPGTLFTVADHFQRHPDDGVVSGEALWMHEDGTTDPMIPSSVTFADLFDYFAGRYLPQPSVFFRSSLLKKVGWLDEDLHYGMDLDLWLRFALQFRPHDVIPRIPRALSLLRVHPAQKTWRDKDTAMLEIARILLRYVDQYHLPSHHRRQVRSACLWVRAFSLLKLRGVARDPSSPRTLMRAADIWRRECPRYLFTLSFVQFALECFGMDIRSARVARKG